MRRIHETMPALLQVVAGIAASFAVVGFTRGGRDAWLAAGLLCAGGILAVAAWQASTRQTTEALREVLSQSVSRASDEIQADLRLAVPGHGHRRRDKLAKASARRSKLHARGLIAIALGTLAVVGLVLYDINQVPDTYYSAYDGTDPFHSQCSNAEGLGSRPSSVLAVVPIRLAGGQVVGHLQLIFSDYCDTEWPRATIVPSAEPLVNGRFLRSTAHRLALNVVAPYVLPLSGGPSGWGNMLAIEDSCVNATAQLLTDPQHPAGPVAATACLPRGER